MMKTFENELISNIKEKRPKLRESSLNLYVNNIKKLNKFIGNDEFKNIDFLNNKNDVEKALLGKSNHTIKTYYASIVVALMAMDAKDDLIDMYRDDMEKLQEDYKNKMDGQQKTDKQKKNWLEYDELLKIMNNLRKKVNYEKLLNKKELSNKEKNLLQQWLVSSLYLLEPEANPPVRLNYAPMIVISEKDFIKNQLENKDKVLEDNYLVIKSRNNKYFSFNNYKTSGTYLTKEIPVGKKLNSVINSWLKFNKSGYLLLNSKDEPMNSNGLTKFINKIFEHTGKKVSVSMIRHAYLSDRYEADNEDKQAIADLMMHSQSQQTEYIKE